MAASALRVALLETFMLRPTRPVVVKQFQKARKCLQTGSSRTMAKVHVLGPFRLDAEAEIFFRGSEPVGLGQRAVALLRVLVQRAGAPVSKDVLIEAAWSGLVVEDANLTVQIAALRRALSKHPGGERWI